MATVILVPLAVNPWGFNYQLPKVVLLRALTLLMVAAHLLALAQGSRPPDPHRWLRRPLVRPILLVTGATLISTLASLSPLVSLRGSFHRQQGAYLLLCFTLWTLIVVARLRSTAQRHRLVTAVVLAGSLVALTPLAKTLFAGQSLLTTRPGGTLGNPIFLGAYLIMVIPFTLAKVQPLLAGPKQLRPSEAAPLHRPISSSARLRVVGWSAALALQLFALLITQSRGPWVGVLAGLAVFAALTLWPSHRRLALAGLVAVPLLIGGLVAGLNFGLAPSDRLAQLPYVSRVVLPSGLAEGTIRVRLVLWQSAVRVVTTWPDVGLSPDRLQWLRPLVGYGPDTAAIVYTSVYPPELAHIEDPDALWDRAHNETLDLLAMQGWLGFAVTLALGAACARRGLALWRTAHGPTERAWIAAPLAALTAHVVEVQFAFSLATTGMMTWLCVACLASDGENASSGFDDHRPTENVKTCQESPCSQDCPQPRRGRWPSVRWQVYAAVGALLLTLIAVRLEGGAIWADVLVARARALDRANRWQESIERYDQALALIPWQATYHQFRAEAFYNLARALPDGQVTLKDDLLAAADRSLAYARQLELLELELYSNGGVLHAYWSEALDPAHLKTAEVFYQQAFRLAPTKAELRTELGHVYHNHGLFEEALAEYRAALDIDPQFATAYYDSGLAWQALRQPALAREAFQAALEIIPDCIACREALQMLDE